MKKETVTVVQSSPGSHVSAMGLHELVCLDA